MLAYPPSAAANQVLNIIDCESKGAVRGIERPVIHGQECASSLRIESGSDALAQPTGDRA